jgi:hypothetical protein
VSCGAECLPHASPRATRQTAAQVLGNSSQTASRRQPSEELVSEPADDDGEDWLGQQLALLSRAERSLLEGNPDRALRLLDEYQVRFPKGLLDVQIGALRERAEQPVEAFIFP